MSDETRLDEKHIRVVIVDDHQIVRDGLRLILQIEGKDIEMVGDASDGVAALHLIEKAQPDVVLMDLRMPGMGGLEAITQIRARWPGIAVVILTTYNEDELMLRGLRAGACGYLLKDVNRETLLHSIRRAAQGETLLQPEIFSRLLSLTQSSASSDTTTERAKKADRLELTERERSILTGVARGERSKEIAARLGITAATVAAHLTNIYSKLGADSRASAVAIALQRGLLSMEEENDIP